MWKRITIAMACAGALSPSAASAQERSAAVMLELGGHREIPAEARAAARTAAAELLRTEDMIVLPDLHLSGLDAALRECAPSAPCAIETRSALGVDLLIGLTIWGTAADPSTAESVHASVIDTTGTRYVGSATVRQGVPTAVRDALREVLRRQLRGPGPHLDIAGTETAFCELDGAAVGTIPVTVRVAAGDHQLVVHLDGYETQTLAIAIGEDAGHTTEIDVTLRREGGPSATPASEPDVVANLLLGGGIALGGMAFALAPAIAATQGECADVGPGGACRERRTFGAASAALLGVGAALLVTGVIIAAVQPITVSASASSDGAYLQLRGSF